MVKKKKSAKKSSIKKVKNEKPTRHQFKSDFWLIAIFVIVVARTILLLPGTTGAIIADPSLIMYDPLESEATIIENGGTMSGITFVHGHLTKKTYISFGGRLFISEPIEDDKAALIEPGDKITYSVPKDWNVDRGAIEMMIKPNWDPGSVATDKHMFFSAYDKDLPKARKIELLYSPPYSAFVLRVIKDYKEFEALLAGNANPWNVYQWNHLAASWGPKYGLRVYLNGVEQGRYRTAPGIGTEWQDVDININPDILVIGNAGGLDRRDTPADAVIDEIKLYNEEKTIFTIT